MGAGSAFKTVRDSGALAEGAGPARRTDGGIAVTETGIPPGIEVVRKAVRRVSIRVLPDATVRITAPPGCAIGPVLERHAAWISRHQARIRAVADAHAGSEDYFLLFGRHFHCVHHETTGVDEAAGEVRYTTPGALKAALKTWLARDLEGRIERRSGEMGVSPPRLTIRMQRTRWASCSSRGTINANLRLIALPDHLREYIVVHELAHLIEANHSPRYWAVVHAHYPQTDTAEALLKEFWVALERNTYWKHLGSR
ncbi:MAG: M48 family metallopeptidase [Methanomicrobiales archaeon]|nr:M48 family metallopeptidase [Methanomicrobiales archaeon]